MAVLIYPVVCVHPCHLLGTQHHCLWPNGRKGLPSACPPTLTTPSHLPTPLYTIPMILRPCTLHTTHLSEMMHFPHMR